MDLRTTARIGQVTVAAVAAAVVAVMVDAPALGDESRNLAAANPADPRPPAGATGRGKMVISVAGKPGGKAVKVKVRGISGPAAGSVRKVRIRNTKTLRSLQVGRYRIKPQPIGSGNRTSKAVVKPRRPKIRAGRTAKVRIVYRDATSEEDTGVSQDTVIGATSVNGPSSHIAVTPPGVAGTTAYVSLEDAFAIAVVDMGGSDPAVIRRFAATSPRGLAVSPDGRTLYVADVDPVSGAGLLARRNTTDGSALGPAIAVGRNPRGVAVSPDGSRVYVANSGDRTVSVVDPAAGRVTTRIQVRDNPTALAVSPDGTRLYVAAAQLNVIDTSTNRIVATVPTPTAATGVAVSSTGRDVYVSSSNLLTIVDAQRNAVSFLVRIPGTLASSVTLSPDDARAYVTVGSSGAADGSIQVVDTVRRRLIDSINNVPGASDLGFRRDGSYAVAAQRIGNTMAVVAMAPRAASPSGVGVAGTPRPGQTLTAIADTVGSSPFPPAVTYRWQVAAGASSPFQDIPGERGTRYVVRSRDQGRYLRVVLTAENQGGKQEAFSEAVGVPRPPATPTSPSTTPAPSAPAPSAPAPTSPPTSPPRPPTSPTTSPPRPPTSAPSGGPTATPTPVLPPAPKASVTAKATARRSKLLAQVGPPLGTSNQWSFRVQKRVKGDWRTRSKVYRTTGAASTRRINLKKGKYRVLVPAAYGYGRATSRPVKLRR